MWQGINFGSFAGVVIDFTLKNTCDKIISSKSVDRFTRLPQACKCVCSVNVH